MNVTNNSEKKVNLGTDSTTDTQLLHDVLNYAYTMPGISGPNADKVLAAKNAIAAILAG